jgi:hypothetical protein
MGILQMLLGGRREVVVLVHNTSEGGTEGSYDSAGIDCNASFANTGVFVGSKATSGATSPYNWLISGLAADAEIFVHQVAGAAVSGIALDTWLVLSTSRAITLAWPGGVGNSATVQVSIRDRVTGIVKVNAVTLALTTHP